MAKPTDKDRVMRWQRRIDTANKLYQKWEKKYRCEELEQAYYGHQYESGGIENREKYVINEIFSTIETQLPSQLFYHPKVTVRAKANKLDDQNSDADARAQLQEDTINSFIIDRGNAFLEETTDCLLESYFRFGVLETGYTGNPVDNPQAGKPLLNENEDDDAETPIAPASIPTWENLYFKRIPARTFRVGVGSGTIKNLKRCDWYGYYEWHYPEDLKDKTFNPRYKNTSAIPLAGKISRDIQAEYANDEDASKHEGMCKLWKIWDVRGKCRHDFVEGAEKFLLDSEPLELREDGTPILPHAVLIKHKKLDSPYPLPPVYNWMSPQRWLNEQRNLYIVMLKKLIPKFLAHPDMDPKEVEKFLLDEMVVIEGRADGIVPVAMPGADNGVLRSSPVTKDDFREISGTSGEERGIAAADTATQANIIQISSQTRSNKSREQVANWLAEVAELSLWFLKKRMTGPFWVQTNVDVQGPSLLNEAIGVMKTWQQITADHIGGITSEITVDMDSIAPQTPQGERQDWIQALLIIADPARAPILLANPILLKKTMNMFGVKNEKELQAIQQFGVHILQMQMMAQRQPAGGAPGIPGNAAPGPTPDNMAIQGQLSAQANPSGVF